MHNSMLPIHIKENGDKTFIISQHQKGKDYFKSFQDRFYYYMKERLYLLEHAERLNEIEKLIDDRVRETDEIKAYNNEIDRYCREYELSYY